MTAGLKLYKALTLACAPLLKTLLKRRISQGKEDRDRLNERMGQATQERPAGHLLWFHAASVGESQSVLILLKTFQKKFPDCRFLVTTGTRSSAALMDKRLPDWALHQYYPLDHPKWIFSFLDHWRPDLAIWVESELWPNMLLELRNRQVPIALVNARMSKKSYNRWRLVPRSARRLLNVFDLFLAQTQQDARYYKNLGAKNVVLTDSLKYAAQPLPYDENELNRFDKALETRMGWLYASTHAGEEKLSMEIHCSLKKNFPTLLTLIAPRNPARADEIAQLAARYDLTLHKRSENKAPPDPETDIYLIDTFGELGLFYKLSGLACIGRSLSDDGGGGHNPIEAVQLGCAVLHGPLVQNFSEIYEEMDHAKAAIKCEDKEDLKHNLARLFFNTENIYHLQKSAFDFVSGKTVVIEQIVQELDPLLIEAGLYCQPPESRKTNGQKQKCA